LFLQFFDFFKEMVNRLHPSGHQSTLHLPHIHPFINRRRGQPCKARREQLKES